MDQKELFKKARLFSSIFAKSKKRIIAKLLSSDTYTLLEKERILREVDEELKKLVGQSNSWFNTNLKGAYKEGSSDIYGYLKTIGVKSISYTKYDIETISNLAGNSKLMMNEAISGIHRASSNILTKHTKAKLQAIIAQGRVDSKTLKQISADLAKDLSKNNLYLFDSHGRKWDIEAYSDLVARTEMMNTYNQGVVNQLLVNERDLAYVTSYMSCKCDICKSWEGKVVSLTGKTEGYPTLDEAYGDGLFHPNCKHTLRPYYGNEGNIIDKSSMDLLSINPKFTDMVKKGYDLDYVISPEENIKNTMETLIRKGNIGIDTDSFTISNSINNDKQIGFESYKVHTEGWYPGCLESRDMGKTTQEKVSELSIEVMVKERNLDHIVSGYVPDVDGTEFGVSYILELIEKNIRQKI